MRAGPDVSGSERQGVSRDRCRGRLGLRHPGARRRCGSGHASAANRRGSRRDRGSIGALDTPGGGHSSAQRLASAAAGGVGSEAPPRAPRGGQLRPCGLDAAHRRRLRANSRVPGDGGVGLGAGCRCSNAKPDGKGASRNRSANSCEGPGACFPMGVARVEDRRLAQLLWRTSVRDRLAQADAGEPWGIRRRVFSRGFDGVWRLFPRGGRAFGPLSGRCVGWRGGVLGGDGGERGGCRSGHGG